MWFYLQSNARKLKDAMALIVVSSVSALNLDRILALII